jgi:hypothetical protein
MSAPQSPREHALRVAALEALLEAVKAEYKTARDEAEAAFAVAYTQDANDRVMVMLPGGEKVGQVTIKAAPPVVSMLNGGLDGWAAGHIGEEAFEEFIPESVLGSREVLAIIKAALPEVVGRRLRPATAKKLTDQLVKSGGVLDDAATGERDRVADVSPGEVSGAFAFTDAQSALRRARIMAALLGGDPGLRELVGFGPLALPAPEASDAA